MTKYKNTKSPPVPPSKRPTEEFITDNVAAISFGLRASQTPSGLRSRRSQDRHYSIHPDEYSHFQGELGSI
ncbi:hypothetical protein TNCV_2648811 [Trichonephila clavipes]|nr:hypothetical protein TNCV_2648811 [Trichonephila clavipes]